MADKKRSSDTSYKLVQPRRLGLWLLDKKTHLKRVEDAEQHILQLLSDPYYFEAYHRLLRKEAPLLKARKGQLPRKGKLAQRLHELSSSDLLPTTRNQGREVSNEGFNLLIRAFDGRQDGISLPEFCRRALRWLFPNAPDQTIKTKAKELAKALHNRKTWLSYKNLK